jgi:glycosyltransferase involved in cell wall biosynthesis
MPAATDASVFADPVPEMALTVGVIARNGLPHLRPCLDSLADILGAFDNAQSILVDSGSQDATLAAMVEFACLHGKTRVFSIEGRMNAASARNVILKHAQPGALFLVDGDVSINPQFLREGLAAIAAGAADVVVGQLPEVLHDGAHRPIGRNPDRYGIGRQRYVAVTGGVSLLAPHVLANAPRFDERLRTGEDPDFSVRLADRFRILALPVAMGTHYTIDYAHPDRRWTLWRTLHVRPKGTLLRKHLIHPRRLWRLRRSVSGIGLGAAMQIGLVGAILTAGWPGAAVAVAVILLDAARTTHRRGLIGFLLLRFVSPWVLLYGLLFPERATTRYVVREVPTERTDRDPYRHKAG